MKISHLQENLTPSSAPSAPVPGPKFGRSDEMLESDVGTTTAGVIATNMDVKRRGGKKSIFQGIKNAGGFANSRKAGISEDAINEDDLSEENLLAKQRQEEFRFKRSTDRGIGKKPKSREIMAKETKTMASGPDNVSTSGVDYSLTGNDSGKFDVARGSVVSKDSSNSTPVSATPKPGSWQEIAALNNIVDPRKLQANSRIELPNGESMYVNPGDTLSSIAKRLSSPSRDLQFGAPGSSKVIAKQTNAASQKTAPTATGYHDPVYDYKPEVPTSSPKTIHPPGTSITAKIRDPKAPSWPLDVNLTKDADGNWRNEKGQVHNFRVPGDKEQLEKMPALPPNQSSAETKRLASIPKNKQPDIHSQAARDAQWEKDKENMGNAWDEFKGWVKKPRSFTIVPGKGKPAFDPDPTHAVGRQIIPSNGQNIGLWPDELVDRYKSMTGAKDDTKSKDDTKIKQKSTTDKTSSVDPKLSTYHKVIAGIESGNRNFDKNGNPVLSPKGAKFAMQVMPKTNKDPAYGVVPAKDDSPKESNRVGRDYFDAMMKKYDGDTQKASAAYNAGPGRLDRVLAKAEKNGKDWRNLLPRETRNYLKKFNKGIEVASNNDDSMNEDISQRYARDYEYILEYLLSEADPRNRGDRGLDLPPLEGGATGGGGGFVNSKPSIGIPQNTGRLEIGPQVRGSVRPGLQRQQANSQTKINTSATPKVMRDRNDSKFDPNMSTKGSMTGQTLPVNAKVKPDSDVSTYNPKTKTWSPGPDPAIKSSNVNVEPVNTTPKYDPKLDAGNYNARGDYVGPNTASTSTRPNFKRNDSPSTTPATNNKPKTNDTTPSIHPNWSKDPAELLKQKGNWFTRNPYKTGVGVAAAVGLAGTYGVDKVKDAIYGKDRDPENPSDGKPIQYDVEKEVDAVLNPPEVKPVEVEPAEIKKSDDDDMPVDFNYDEKSGKTNESTISRIGDEYEQILESMINRLSLSEKRTETKNEKGEVTSWRDDSDWRKVGKNKNGRGRVTNLSDKARRETEKLTQNRQKKADDAAKRFMDEPKYDNSNQDRQKKADDAAKRFMQGMAEAQLDELSKDTIKNYVKAQPTRIKGPTGLATTNPKKAARIVDTEKGDIRRALTKLKDPAYGQQGVTEMNVGKRKPKPDSYHINKDGNPVSLASYGDKDSAIKDRDEKHPGAEVHQVGSRGKVKGKFEEGALEEEKPGLWANIHAKRERIKHGSGEKMRKPGSKGAPTADALRKSAK